MIAQDIKQTLFLFKRIHKQQIAPHDPVLSAETESLIHRKTLKSMNEKELKQLAKEVLLSINHFQKKRDKPHQGLIKFKQVLLSKITQNPNIAPLPQE